MRCTLVFPEFIECLFAELKKLDLFGEHVERHVDWPPKTSVRLIVVENGVEAWSITIEKVLVPKRVEIAHSPLWIAE